MNCSTLPVIDEYGDPGIDFKYVDKVLDLNLGLGMTFHGSKNPI